MEAQESLLQVPRTASTHEVPEGAVDTLPAALHGEDAQAQLPATEAVEGREYKQSRGGQDPARAPGEAGIASLARSLGPGRVDGLGIQMDLPQMLQEKGEAE